MNVLHVNHNMILSNDLLVFKQETHVNVFK